MQNPVKERIVKLREEKAQISEANRLYLPGGKNQLPGAAEDHQRRPQRLQEILDELARSLTGKDYEQGCSETTVVSGDAVPLRTPVNEPKDDVSTVMASWRASLPSAVTQNRPTRMRLWDVDSDARQQPSLP
jgi:hypothetical protein